MPESESEFASESGVPDPDVVLFVDVANVMGARPDGWWRDRAAAATRLVRELAGLGGAVVAGPDGRRLRIATVVAVVEGQARSIPAVTGVELVRSDRDGDTALVAACAPLAPPTVLAVTADRGLRARLAPGCATAGPRWLLDLLSRRVGVAGGF